MENRIAEIRESKGLKQTELAEMLGIHRTNLNRIEKGHAFPTMARLAQIARILEVDLSDLFAPDPGKYRVSINGYVGAGAVIDSQFEQMPPEGLEEIDLPFPLYDEMLGLGVRGPSMLPRYDDGDVIIVYREQRRPTNTFFGEEAAVRLRDGRRYLKQIMRDGTGITLYSWNDHPIVNVDIEWVGEIHSTVRANQVRRFSMPQRQMPKRAKVA